MNASPEILRLLSGLLASPGNESLDVLRELTAQHAWLVKPVAELEQTPLEEWQAEHTRLFISGHPKTVCPPFESAFLRGTMFSTASDQLGDLYRRAGLQAESLPPDYLGTQLECAAYLSEQPCNHSSELLLELWREHLSAWLPKFGSALQQESRLLLYRLFGRQLAELSLD
ncbi:MAG: molecular chaperone TorD family protein [Nitrosomonadales bacterium]|nr:molecular chaperone TorD family protein [Nitrosomonadales bacterium]